MEFFSYCVITASDETQAAAFRLLLNRRVDHGLYPREINFRVYSDPPGGRIGSGGGTIWALSRLLAEEHTGSAEDFFAGERVLVLHAGGESRRLPVYAPEGKLFAPVPVPSSSILAPVVLDLDLTLFLKFPWQDGDVVIASGDVILDFDTDALDIPSDLDLCGFAAPMSLAEGSHHGVYRLASGQSRVADFYQKQSPEFLSLNARLEGTEQCALDIGIVTLRPNAVSRLLSLADSKDSAGVSYLDRLAGGTLRFDLYLELLTACLPNLSFSDYTQRIANQTSASQDDLARLYESFHPLTLGCVLTRSAEFLHFGSLLDFPNAARRLSEIRLLPFYAEGSPELYPQVASHVISTNSFGAQLVGPGAMSPSVVENCGAAALTLDGGQIVSGIPDGWGVDASPVHIPQGICLDVRAVTLNGHGQSVAMILGRDDTFGRTTDRERMTFCGISQTEWMDQRGLSAADAMPASAELLDLELFVIDPDPSFVAGYWSVPLDIRSWQKRFRISRKMSIRQINSATDVLARDVRRSELRARSLRAQILGGGGWRTTSVSDFRASTEEADADNLAKLISLTDDRLLRMYRTQLMGDRFPNAPAEDTSEESTISFFDSSTLKRVLKRNVKVDQIVWARAPVRLDLAGGWSDTPPYTSRYGGIVTNVAVDLNGQPPIQVFVRPTRELHVRFNSIDTGVAETVTRVGELTDFRNPQSPFALAKAALCLLGLVPQDHLGSDDLLSTYLTSIGSGLDITILCAVPKGSGLGTSSILAGAILSAVERFFGVLSTRDELFLKVLEVEQMLTTGGGWQDQIGGIAGGVKYIESRPGLKSRPVIYQLDSYLFEHPEYANCMTLFYTGITRLAKNILQEVVAGVNRATPAYLFTHATLKKLASDAREAISLRDLGALASVVNASWKANIRIHPSTTNGEIDAMVEATSPYFHGMKLLGAGGGGYALFISDTLSSAEQLREALRNGFEAERARLVDFSLNQDGMLVTVS